MGGHSSSRETLIPWNQGPFATRKHGGTDRERTETCQVRKNKNVNVCIAGALMCTAWNLFSQELPGQWYLGLDTGAVLQQEITIQDGGKLTFDPGFRLDVSGGVHLSQSWKAELELGFLYNSVRSGGESLKSQSWMGFGWTQSKGQDFVQVPMMANVTYTLPLQGPIRAYGGAGIGGVYSVLWQDILASKEGLAFGYQVILGLKYALNEDLDLGLSYKFLGTTEHELGATKVDGTIAHSILAAVTFKF